jgi:hypothetical protein
MKIFLDIDDVLADTVAALEQQFGPAVDPTSKTLDDFFPGKAYRRYLDDPDFNLMLPPVQGSVAGVAEIAAAGHSLEYLSARIPALTEPTLHWLSNQGYPQAPLQCVGRRAKQALLESMSYGLLIDDQLTYLEIASNRGILALAYAYPWNEAWVGKRLLSWIDINEELKRINIS